MKDRFSILPIDIQLNILSYTNPYKDQFTKCIINNNSIWESSWLYYYMKIKNNEEKMVIAYILSCLGIITQDIYSYTFKKYQKIYPYKYKYNKIKFERWIRYYPTDIHIELTDNINNTFVTIYHDINIHISVIENHFVIIKKGDNRLKNVNYSMSYFHVFSNSEYNLYIYEGFGRPSPLSNHL